MIVYIVLACRTSPVPQKATIYATSEEMLEKVKKALTDEKWLFLDCVVATNPFAVGNAISASDWLKVKSNV